MGEEGLEGSDGGMNVSHEIASVFVLSGERVFLFFYFFTTTVFKSKLFKRNSNEKKKQGMSRNFCLVCLGRNKFFLSQQHKQYSMRLISYK